MNIEKINIEKVLGDVKGDKGNRDLHFIVGKDRKMLSYHLAIVGRHSPVLRALVKDRQNTVGRSWTAVLGLDVSPSSFSKLIGFF